MMIVHWGPQLSLGDTQSLHTVHLRLLITLWIFQLHHAHAIYFEFVMDNSHSVLQKPSTDTSHSTLSWAVKIRENEHRKMHNRTQVLNKVAEFTAQDLGLTNFGQVGELVGHYLFVHPSYYSSLNGSLNGDEIQTIQAKTEDRISGHSSVDWFSQQQIRRRTKRSIKFDDPVYPKQWHLHNKKTPGMDINVTGIWEHNITGSGIIVAVIDDGLEWTNPDIYDNYCPEGSWDLNANDPDPMPEVHNKKSKTVNRHGTRCAGEIAAVPNNKCAVGVAYGAKVSGVRLLDGPMTDSLEATAFNKHMSVNDIYSCSWGPDDDGKTIDGPHPLAQAALKHGVLAGRRGRGSLFVVASGNGGRNDDNCNYDGYANSMYTITIGAVDERGQMPYYAEECASMLAVTFSSGSVGKRNIVTTDWTLDSGTGCTTTHTGTSAAAPLAAGMIALMLEAKECLSWRDVQHIIVYTSVKVDTKDAKWDINSAGFYHSHKHGFGLLNAWRLVNAAKVWHSVPWLTSFVTSTIKVNLPIPSEQRTVTTTYTVSNSSAQEVELATLEHVLITVTLTHPYRGNLQIELVCPSGTKSIIGAKRKRDSSGDGLKGWTFSTVRCWGEEPIGVWQLQITDYGAVGGGALVDWKLHLYGSRMTSAEVQTRKIMVEEAMSGNHLGDNLTEPCSFYWTNTYGEEANLLTIKSIRLLCLVSGFLLLAAVYYSIEQAFCNEEDKQECTKVTADDTNNSVMPPSTDTNGERTRLLEEIPLQDLDGGLEEVITDFANSRCDGPESVDVGGIREGMIYNNSLGQSSHGERSQADTTQLSCAAMETVVMDTNKVQSVNNTNSNDADGELSMLRNSMNASESCCIEDNANNEKTVIQSPSLAVESRISSTPPITTSLPCEVGGDVKENTHNLDHVVLSSTISPDYDSSSSVDVWVNEHQPFKCSPDMPQDTSSSSSLGFQVVELTAEIEEQHSESNAPPFLQ
ncbi:proprotein convertase subtilisin/kexin type 7-like [Amphiura filiformis]|uniref:proprotein convertase subtilisin/kexin type 7-like n=1 Tax=Amphiura filiformis TaxID=82378 RepID=UPI003B2216D6